LVKSMRTGPASICARNPCPALRVLDANERVSPVRAGRTISAEPSVSHRYPGSAVNAKFSVAPGST
jgi:hypothetical protein